MPGKHTPTQRRQAAHVARSERALGKGKRQAQSIGWATVNKLNRKKKAR